MRNKLPRARSRRFTEFFQDDDKIEGYSLVASSHWKAAEMLRLKATHGLSRTRNIPSMHWLIVPAICLYHASLDCYLNETLAGSMLKLRKAKNTTLIERCQTVQDQTLN